MTPAVNLSAGKYELKLEVPSADGMTDMHLRFNSVSVFNFSFYRHFDSNEGSLLKPF